jgi:hypothetical protein
MPIGSSARVDPCTSGWRDFRLTCGASSERGAQNITPEPIAPGMCAAEAMTVAEIRRTSKLMTSSNASALPLSSCSAEHC